MNDRSLILARLEIVCGAAWFFDDGFWLMGWRWPCYAACVVAAIAALLIPAYLPRRLVPTLICGADTCWLAFNILWSVGDLEIFEPFNTAAKVAFFLGAGFFAAALLCANQLRDAFALVLGRLRFFSNQ